MKCPLQKEANYKHIRIRISNKSDNVRDSWKFRDLVAVLRSSDLKGQGRV
jgi:hypothetical protein